MASESGRQKSEGATTRVHLVLLQRLKEEFLNRYKPGGRSKALMDEFLRDWRTKLVDTQEPTAEAVRQFLVYQKRDRFERWIVDGSCRVLLGCSYSECCNQFEQDQTVQEIGLRQNQQMVVAPVEDTRGEIAEQVGGDRASMSQSNPFGDSGKITDPTRFFGREPLLRHLFEELSKGCNISLVGEPQIGKSSLLWMVYTLGEEGLKPCPDGFIYLDMQTVHDEDAFFEELCYELDVPTERKNNLSRELRGKRYILCLDEIEVLTDEECFPSRVRSKLRGLSDGASAPFKLVTASRSPLAQLFSDSPNKRSPLDIPPTNVLPFSREEAENFLNHRLKGTGITFTPNEIDNLINQSGGHPAKLQRAAAELFNRYRGLT